MNPDKYSSRRIFEIIGSKFIEIVDVPETSDVYSAEESKKYIDEWSL